MDSPPTRSLPSRLLLTRLRALLPSGKLGLAVVASILLLGSSAPLVQRSLSHLSSSEDDTRQFLTAVVERGPFEIGIEQQGHIDSANNAILANQCEWSTTILTVVPEGTSVLKGDIVGTLDASELVERQRGLRVNLIEAEAELEQARQVVDMQKLENETGVSQAMLTLQFAELDLEGYRDGEFPQLESKLESAVALAEEEANRAQKQYEYTQRLVRKGYRNPIDLEQERIKLAKTEYVLDNARNSLDVLRDYTSQRMIAQLEAELQEAKINVERVHQIAHAALLSREVKVRTNERKVIALNEYMERLDKAIAACTLRAPADGLLVHLNEGRIKNEVIPGAKVRYRQNLMTVPDRTQMEVKVRIHESRIRLVEEGRPAVITVDALPNMSFKGYVKEVSKVPTAGKYPNYDLKVYPTTIQIDGSEEELAHLKPGLTARVKIFAEHLSDVLQVPMQSVVEIGDDFYTFVATGTGVDQREVTVGRSNVTDWQITSGLQEGEAVIMSPRTSCAPQIAVLEADSAVGSIDDDNAPSDDAPGNDTLAVTPEAL